MSPRSRRRLAALSGAAICLALAFTANAVPASAASGDVSVNIIGGSDATETYPAVRLLTVYDGLGTARCTGSLARVRGQVVVVTTAHCVTDFDTAEAMPLNKITVQLGSVLDALTDVAPTRLEVQPGWDWGTGTDAFSDVAVLTLPRSVHLAGIPIGELTWPGRQVRLLGWGKTTADATVPPPVLQQLDTHITATSACAEAGITAGEICIAPAENGGQACHGDSGGPALGYSRTGWVVLGAASRVTDENTCTGPSVYTSVPYWAPWITSAVSGHRPYLRPHVEAGAAIRYLQRTANPVTRQ